jgi:hypothetical protein
MKDYQYYGLFLDIDTKNMLMDTLTDNIDYNIALGVADRIFIDHCTLLHKSQLDSNENLQSYLESSLGKSMSIRLVAVGISDKAMAFKVEEVDNICANEVPHITIATFRGGNPVDSNKIANWRYIEPIIVNVRLEKR